MKYAEGVKKRLEESEGQDAQIKRSEKKGKSDLKVQISLLEGKIVEAEAEVETREEALNDAKFEMPFRIEAVDNAESSLNKANKKLSNLRDTLKSRKSLLKELFSGS